MSKRSLDTKSVFFSVAEERLGFEFGKPERVDEESLAVVLPILRRTSVPRAYTTYPEVQTTEVRDTGSIDLMKAHNAGEVAVFIRSGTIFKGATQERASMRSVVVLPGKKAEIKVRCVHASKPINSGSNVRHSGITPLIYEQQVYTHQFTPGGQAAYWKAATTTNVMMASVKSTSATSLKDISRSGWGQVSATPIAHSGGYTYYPSLTVGSLRMGSDDLSSHYEQFSADMDAVLSKVKMHEDQTGMALITDKGCETIELFEAPVSWKALHADAVKRIGPNLAQKDKSGVFEYNPDKAKAAVQDVLGLPFEESLIYEHKPNNGDPYFKVVGLSSGQFTGEAVEFDGKLIHLMLLRMKG